MIDFIQTLYDFLTPFDGEAAAAFTVLVAWVSLVLLYAGLLDMDLTDDQGSDE